MSQEPTAVSTVADLSEIATDSSVQPSAPGGQSTATDGEDPCDRATKFAIMLKAIEDACKATDALESSRGQDDSRTESGVENAPNDVSELVLRAKSLYDQWTPMLPLDASQGPTVKPEFDVRTARCLPLFKQEPDGHAWARIPGRASDLRRARDAWPKDVTLGSNEDIVSTWIDDMTRKHDTAEWVRELLTLNNVKVWSVYDPVNSETGRSKIPANANPQYRSFSEDDPVPTVAAVNEMRTWHDLRRSATSALEARRLASSTGDPDDIRRAGEAWADAESLYKNWDARGLKKVEPFDESVAEGLERLGAEPILWSKPASLYMKADTASFFLANSDVFDSAKAMVRPLIDDVINRFGAGGKLAFQMSRLNNQTIPSFWDEVKERASQQ